MENELIKIGTQTIGNFAELFGFPYSAIKELESVPNQLFLLKAKRVINGVEDLNQKNYRDREKLDQKLQRICKEDTVKIIDLINRIEYSEKADYLAKTMYLFIWSVITRDEFFRYSDILDAILVEDLLSFKSYMFKREELKATHEGFACALEKVNLFTELKSGLSIHPEIPDEHFKNGVENRKAYGPTKLGVDFYNKILKDKEN